MTLSKPAKLSLGIAGVLLLLLSIGLVVIGLSSRTPQLTADLLFEVRNWTTILGSLLVSVAIVVKPKVSKTELLLIPLLTFSFWLVLMLIMAFIGFSAVSSA
jgi:hypothetical protein